MAATFRLEFDASGGEPFAQIGLGSTHGGIVEGCPILTVPCSNLADLVREIKQLHVELDKIEKEAKEKFLSTPQSKKLQEDYNQALKKLGRKNLAKFSRFERRKS